MKKILKIIAIIIFVVFLIGYIGNKLEKKKTNNKKEDYEIVVENIEPSFINLSIFIKDTSYNNIKKITDELILKYNKEKNKSLDITYFKNRDIAEIYNKEIFKVDNKKADEMFKSVLYFYKYNFSNKYENLKKAN